MENYWFGVLFNIFGSIFVNFGTNIMKYAHSLSSPSSTSSSNSHAINISDSSINSTTDNPQPLLAVQKSPRPSHSPASSSSFILHSSTRTNTPLTFAGLSMTWTRGCFLFAIGSALTFFSFAFASQSLLSSLGTLQFISNVFFSRFVLGEKLSLRVVIATGLIGAGIVITVAFSNHSSKVYTVQDLLRLYDANYFFFLQMIGLAICLQAGVYILYTRRERRQLPLPLSGIVRPVVFASMAATIGTQSVLQSKCLAEIIKSSSLGDAQQQIWFIGIILLVFVIGLSIWLISLNEALKEFDGAVIIPLLQGNRRTVD